MQGSMLCFGSHVLVPNLLKYSTGSKCKPVCCVCLVNHETSMVGRLVVSYHYKVVAKQSLTTLLTWYMKFIEISFVYAAYL